MQFSISNLDHRLISICATVCSLSLSPKNCQCQFCSCTDDHYQSWRSSGRSPPLHSKLHLIFNVDLYHHIPTIMFSRPRLRPNGFRKLFQTNVTPRRNLIAAPKPGSGPLMERRSDRALPSISTNSYRWLRTVPIFAALMTASVLAIFNYQKQSSSVVSSTLYALRTNQQAREILGDEIYFAHQIPWISGEINQLHGRIDISFSVKGTKDRGVMRFKSLREGRMGYV